MALRNSAKFFLVFFILTFSSSALSQVIQNLFNTVDIFNTSLIPDLSGLPEEITVPGTKWCGPGDTAKSYNDVGLWKETDKCCREHDNCPDIIEGKDTKHGLKNSDRFTRLNCDCDEKFLKCLQQARKVTSIAVGKVYFSVRRYCFKYDYPILKCTKYQGGILKLRCLEYKLDNNKPKKWQWFDIPLFTLA